MAAERSGRRPAREIAPKISDDYTQRNSALTAMLLQIAAEEWDRAAARRNCINAFDQRAIVARFARIDHIRDLAAVPLPRGRERRIDLIGQFA